MVNLKSASFVIIMLLQEGLTHTHSQQSLGCFLSFALNKFIFLWTTLAADWARRIFHNKVEVMRYPNK